MRARSHRTRARLATTLLVALVTTSLSTRARADDDAARPYFTIGFPVMLSGVFADTVQWGIIGTTSDSAHWAWHLIPVAGPIIGFQAFGASQCGEGHSEPQCGAGKVVIQSSELLYLGFEITGLVLVGAGLYKRTLPRFEPAVARGSSPASRGPTAGSDAAWSPLPFSLTPRMTASRDAFQLGVSRAF